jgi:hypothetical protein
MLNDVMNAIIYGSQKFISKSQKLNYNNLTN